MNRTQLIVAAVTIIIIVGLFIILKPKDTNQSTSSAPTASQTAQPTPGPKLFELQVKDNHLVSGPETIQVSQGDQVDIRIQADVDGELHLHGYDKAVEFKKDTPADLIFTADTSGRFPYELEDTKTDLGALEVLPK